MNKTRLKLLQTFNQNNSVLAMGKREFMELKKMINDGTIQAEITDCFSLPSKNVYSLSAKLKQ